MLPYLWLILIPAVLLVLAVQYFFTGRWEPGKRVRLFLGLLAAMALINGVVGGLNRLFDSIQPALIEPSSPLCSSLGRSCNTVREIVWVFSRITGSLFLMQVAVAAALFLFWPGRQGWTPGRIALAVGLGGLALLAGAFAAQSFIYFAVAILLVGGLVILVWHAWDWRGRLRMAAWAGLAFFLGLVGLYELNPSIVWNSETPGIFSLPFLILGIWPAVAASLATRSFYSALAPIRPVCSQASAVQTISEQETGGESVSARSASGSQGAGATFPRSAWPEVARRLALLAAALLLFWQLNGELAREGMWDGMEDGLSSVFIQQTVIAVGLAGAAVMAWSLAGWRKLGALVFAALVLFDMSWAMENSWKQDAGEYTEASAARIGRAVEAYQRRNGSYPQDLDQLVPFYLLSLPQPVMERGESWCYQVGQDFYRLGYVWKPGFGPPPEMFKVRIAASAGQPPEGPWQCDEDLARIKQVWAEYWKDAKIYP